MRSKWDDRYLGLADHVAQWSKDPSTKVGAVIVGKRVGHVAFGYNGFPPGIADTPERLSDRPTKYRLTQHAERNALDNAQFDLDGAALYVTLFPCTECAKSIITRGIRTVVARKLPDREPWISEANVAVALFREAGVSVMLTENPLDSDFVPPPRKEYLR